MRISWVGPALTRRVAAPSHRGSALALALWATSMCGACNIGHRAPELDDTNDTDHTQRFNEPDAHRGVNDATGDADAASGSVPIACNEDAYRCVMSGKPDRERCDHGAWVPAEACGRGLVCELANASTTTCVSSPTSCDGGTCGGSCTAGTVSCQYVAGAPDVVLSCPNGTTVLNTCNGDTPHCVNQEGCKECSRAAHCKAEPPPCHEYTCNDDFACELVPLTDGQKCATGVCSESALCVQCNVAADCGEPENCHQFTCDDHVCVTVVANERTACLSETGVLCNAAGDCVECLTPDDCTSTVATECHQATCGDGACKLQPAPELSPCSPDTPGVCDGTGACVACLTADPCNNGNMCHEHVCESSTVHLGLYDDTVEGSNYVYAGLVYLQRLEPLKYPAVLQGFGQIAHVDTGEAIRFALYEDNGRGTGPLGPALTTKIVEGLPEGYQVNPSADSPELQPGVYHWLAFRVTNEVNLRFGSATELSLGTGARFNASTAFDEPFYQANGEDITGLDNTPWAVFAIVQSTQ